ncbi:hypothetical protein F1B92_04280 [Campylobacter sp. FMV-PI01]|uniref:Uncharacterized protein n=1 Tax=Campylobacter portucalensis TaxID=2608384 RepID=A0A6L5WH83_9BACT|nr:hypothetical protein [Campylobacter portucalensis]MSN96404.1 hypothetical protein [Campylobacter portucalensis]
MLFILSNLSIKENALNEYLNLQLNVYFFNLSAEILYFIVAVFLNTVFYFCMEYYLKNKTLDNLEFEKIYPVYNEYVASYFAVCAVVFSMGFLNNTNLLSNIIICIFLFFVFYINNIGYLNPFLYIIGKRIYKVENNSGNFIIITNKNEQMKNTKNISNLVKIDENVFYKIKRMKDEFKTNGYR